MSNQFYHKCEHNPLANEEFNLPSNWNLDQLYNEEDEDGEEIVEDEDEDEDDCDNEDDDYCSDESSTTSTSSTNNQPDNARVCDCCYCEVFGSTTAPVAPTSRNYTEMRERLRLRLSKRRAERCERSTQQNGSVSNDDSANDRGGGINNGPLSLNGVNQGAKASAPIVDQRNLDELLNYINGTGQKDQEKSTSKKRDKNKNNNNNNNNSGKKSNNKNNSHTKSIQREDKDFEKFSNQNHGATNHNHNNNNHHHHNHHHHHPNSTGGDATPNSSSSKRHQPNNSGIHQHHHNSHSCTSHQQNQIEHHQNNQKTSSTGNSRLTPEVVDKLNPSSDQQHDENHQPHQMNPISNGKQKRKDRERTINTKDQVPSKIQHNSPAKTISPSSEGPSREICKTDLGTNQTTSTNFIQRADTIINQDSSLDATTTTRSNHPSCHQNGVPPPQATRKEFDESYLSASEDIFMPRDIDLDDEQLDELERELEAFKRFCFDSVPLVKKERVRVQLKDSNFFRELTESIENGSTISNQQIASTSRPLQTQMFRRKVSRV